MTQIREIVDCMYPVQYGAGSLIIKVGLKSNNNCFTQNAKMRNIAIPKTFNKTPISFKKLRFL